MDLQEKKHVPYIKHTHTHHTILNESFEKDAENCIISKRFFLFGLRQLRIAIFDSI